MTELPLPISEPMAIRLVKSVGGLVESIGRIEKRINELEDRIKRLEDRLGVKTVKEEEGKAEPISEDEKELEEEDSDISF